MSAVATTGINESRRRTYQAAAANQLRGLALVQGASDAQLATASAANVTCVGIQDESTLLAGQPVSCIRMGEATAICGAPVNAGQFVINNAAGQLVPSTAVGDNVVGQAVSSAAVAGDEFVVFVRPFIR